MAETQDVLATLLKETPLEAEMKTMTAEQIIAKLSIANRLSHLCG